MGETAAKLPQTWFDGHFKVALVPSVSSGRALSQHLKTSSAPTENVLPCPSPSTSEEVTMFPSGVAPVQVMVAQSPTLHLSPVPVVLISMPI